MNAHGGKGPDGVRELLGLEHPDHRLPRRGVAERIEQVDVNHAALCEGPQRVGDLLRLHARSVRLDLLGQCVEHRDVAPLGCCEGPRNCGKALRLELSFPAADHALARVLEELGGHQRDFGVRPKKIGQLEGLQMIDSWRDDRGDDGEQHPVADAKRRAGPAHDAHALDGHLPPVGPRVARRSLLLYRRIGGDVEAVVLDVHYDIMQQPLKDRVMLEQMHLPVEVAFRSCKLGHAVEGCRQVEPVHIRQVHLNQVQQLHKVA
mmetsp:Transcript_34899/g.92439  ORF Transcript_34899/g.92439 Transcript_34899/m.92439 type:complete len:262 (+) Transcript_34899:470-1255(+)